MDNKMNYRKAILFLLSGMATVAIALVVGSESKAYGFLTGYGYTATTGGFLVIIYMRYRRQKPRRSPEN